MALPTLIIQLDQPGQPALVLNVGDSEQYVFNYADSAGNPLDFSSGVTGTWDIRDATTATTVISGTAVCALGSVTVNITKAQATSAPVPSGTPPATPWTLGVFRLSVDDGTYHKTLEEGVIQGMT